MKIFKRLIPQSHIKSLRESKLRVFEKSCERRIASDEIQHAATLRTVAGRPEYDRLFDQFVTGINRALRNRDLLTISLDVPGERGPIVIENRESLPVFSDDGFWQIAQIGSRKTAIDLRNVAIHSVNASGRGINRFSNCYIGTLLVGSSSTNYSVTLQNCLVGTMHFRDDEGVTDAVIRKCRIQRLIVPNANLLPYPVRNELELMGTIFETSQDSLLYSGSQSLRNLRINMEKLENTVAAAHLRRHELRAERPNDPAATRFVSAFYDAFSEYGWNTTRPLLWLALIWGISTLIVSMFDGGVIALPLETYVGWKERLIFDDATGGLARSFWLSIQATFSPLAFLGYKQMVVAKFGLTKIFLIVEGLLTDGILLMLIFGIRKRFKIN